MVLNLNTMVVFVGSLFMLERDRVFEYFHK